MSIMACIQPPSLPQDPYSQRQEVTRALSGRWLAICLPWVNLNRFISALHSTAFSKRVSSSGYTVRSSGVLDTLMQVVSEFFSCEVIVWIVSGNDLYICAQLRSFFLQFLALRKLNKQESDQCLNYSFLQSYSYVVFFLAGRKKKSAFRTENYLNSLKHAQPQSAFLLC